MNKAGMEGIIMAIALGYFFGYHAWLMVIRPRIAKYRRPKKSRVHDFYAWGKLGRSIFSDTCCADSKDAILAVQQARNAMTASTYLATVSSILATAGITILLEPSKTQRMSDLAMRDPILSNFPGNPLTRPEYVIMCALVSLYASFVCFGMSVRLYVHWGFYVRCVSSQFNNDTMHTDEVKLVAIRAGLAFTIGMRLFYLFIILILWSGGVTWMMVASFAITSFTCYFDTFESMLDRTDGVDAAREEALETIAMLEVGDAATLSRQVTLVPARDKQG
ncbi:MAG: hypothetical protein J3K34DRAFT_422718 [Monoraphidium minutum]|nr:MAG: hypothetical protein J3K34DRAFT_422718 [Monoraphidium minutum]